MKPKSLIPMTRVKNTTLNDDRDSCADFIFLRKNVFFFFSNLKFTYQKKMIAKIILCRHFDHFNCATDKKYNGENPIEEEYLRLLEMPTSAEFDPHHYDDSDTDDGITQYNFK